MSNTSELFEQLVDANSRYHQFKDYELVGTVEHAIHFRIALRDLIALRPTRVRLGGVSGEDMSLPHEQLLALLKDVEKFITFAQANANAIHYVDLQHYRD